jgi:hypothetical protein
MKGRLIRGFLTFAGVAVATAALLTWWLQTP